MLAPAAESRSTLGASQYRIDATVGEATGHGPADPHSQLMLQALELDNKLFEGAGAGGCAGSPPGMPSN